MGEHVWRVTGSRHLAALDIPIPIIKLLARWGSDVVEQYIADAPLTALTRIYIDKVQSSDAVARGLAAGADPPRLRAVAEQVRRSAIVTASPTTVEQLTSVAGNAVPFVSSVTGKVHLVSLPPRLARRDAVRTPCGWEYNSAVHTLLESVPQSAKCCERCGNAQVWSDVHAIMSSMDSGYDSE